MKRYFFSINISTLDFYPYYQGKIQDIVVTTNEGKTVQFPAMHLRKFLLPTGIKGYFCLKTENNKFLSLEKLA
ncbi:MULTISPECIES: DUF2835 domain-containing protein [Thalassotalea]|uniref:DUF2835 domain-containing protein n=1 Tax=Thalassotalea castellviae TaxID=3075612 RepID=A0ABU2ZW00_9GAMM|nr:DUF2835 domain-containing protein [Thalassotalea sp. W431]MDT0602108.1 DUF2835 domain-containing protein [Thalassotalea sp. W431]